MKFSRKDATKEFRRSMKREAIPSIAFKPVQIRNLTDISKRNLTKRVDQGGHLVVECRAPRLKVGN